MKKCLLFIAVSIMTLSMLLTACGQSGNGQQKLGEEPTLTLTDPLSSQMNSITLSSGSYDWNWEVGFGQMQSVIACGAAPLDVAAMDIVTKVKLPRYNGMDGVTYSFSGGVGPDTLTVRRWDSSAIGNMEAEPLETQVYTYPELLVELLPGSVYEFSAEWAKENLKAYGAYGEASFVLVTE